MTYAVQCYLKAFLYDLCMFSRHSFMINAVQCYLKAFLHDDQCNQFCAVLKKAFLYNQCCAVLFRTYDPHPILCSFILCQEMYCTFARKITVHTHSILPISYRECGTYRFVYFTKLRRGRANEPTGYSFSILSSYYDNPQLTSKQCTLRY